MSSNGLNYVGQLFDNNGEIEDRNTNLENKFYFSWMQLIDSIPVSWKRNIMVTKVTQLIPVFSTVTS